MENNITIIRSQELFKNFAKFRNFAFKDDLWYKEIKENFNGNAIR